ncbi:carboxylesterase/lipase family protein [Mucilaginibacter ginsenosidivorans]|uniref:Carboxylic ester hydrolase n=1 Tax=Mucilaginibacter ginsenosidivorans TaxID=398053 RepID=A0A5B8UWR1_9SPHI|nr:carboxylesterase family protein [Mucilaginibacter ginsenosidivorans]QEC63413.1 carboxylesterase family protein [Mucilaginibacter ginsenosidivorans]
MKKQIKLAFCAVLLAAPIFLYSFVVKTGRLVSLSVAQTDAGTVSGVKNSTGDITAFKGIPFAAPPVGDLRWKAPQPAKHWAGVRKCDAFGPSPMQAKPTPFMVYTAEFLIPEKPISEDCLYLNVWTGAKSKTEKRAVFVYIYGGGFTSGGSACDIYNGEALAKKGVVFVSVNYRVGVFGFFVHPELTKESPEKASGNYGLLDQIAALKWVKKNIAAFGGDPGNVTICGQSAGSMSVNALVASPQAKGLFKKAIAESGSLTIKNPVLPATTLQVAEEQGVKSAEKAGARSLADLRAMPAEDVMKKVQGRYSPIVDGYVLPESIPDIFAANKQNHVSLITGWNADESFIAGFKNKEDYKKQVEQQYGADAAEFLKYFPAETDEQAARSQVEISRNQIFALSGYNWANIQSQYSDSPVYVYNFNRKVPATAEYVKFGAFHTAEVPYIMNDLKFLKNRPLEKADYELADMMSDYWVNFIKTGNPNGKGLPQWPKYNTTAYQVMVFDVNSKAEQVPGKGGLDFMLAKAQK